MTAELARIIPDSAASIALTPKGAMQLRSVGEAAGFAQLMGMNGILPKGVSTGSAVVSIIAGAAVNLNPFEAVQSIAVINGRPSLFGDGMKAVVQGSGALESEKIEWFKDSNGERVACRVTVKRKGVAEPIVGEFSQKMAKRAGLWGKSGPWTQYPDRMLLARARAFAYRDGFADVLKGVRSAEEEQDIILAETSSATPAAQSEVKRTRRASASEILASSQSLADGAGKAAGAVAGGGDASPAPSMPPRPENALAGTLGGENPPPAETDGTPPPAPPAQDAETAPETTSDAIDGDAEWLN